jgi:hypothetical protein
MLGLAGPFEIHLARGRQRKSMAREPLDQMEAHIDREHFIRPCKIQNLDIVEQKNPDCERHALSEV